MTQQQLADLKAQAGAARVWADRPLSYWGDIQDRDAARVAANDLAEEYFAALRASKGTA
jgi:hypothetical protein